MNAKLDALIIALERADNRLGGLELKPESDAKALCDEIQPSVADAVNGFSGRDREVSACDGASISKPDDVVADELSVLIQEPPRRPTAGPRS